MDCGPVNKAHKLCLDLIDILLLINSSHDADEILQQVVQESSKAIGCESARIVMREGDRWVIRYVDNLADDLIGRAFTDQELPHAALAATTGEPVAIDDAFHDDRTNTGLMQSLGIRSVLALPLMARGLVTGALLYGYHSRAMAFTEAEIEYAKKMATGVAITLQQAHLYQDLAAAEKRNDIARRQIEKELRETNKELESFNYTVAHDLRKPLTVICGYAQLLMEADNGKFDDQCREYVKEIYVGSLHMDRLIDALLEFSRLAHTQPKNEPTNLSLICEKVAAELALAEPKRKVSFRRTRGLEVGADPELLRVVLSNLLGNAWKYTGGCEEGIIEFGATEVDGRRAFFVRDNGIGFDPAHAEKIFIPFQRLVCGEEISGLGIGLATVARIIKHHGGEVWAEGVPGKGATFYFTLH